MVEGCFVGVGGAVAVGVVAGLGGMVAGGDGVVVVEGELGQEVVDVGQVEDVAGTFGDEAGFFDVAAGLLPIAFGTGETGLGQKDSGFIEFNCRLMARQRRRAWSRCWVAVGEVVVDQGSPA